MSSPTYRIQYHHGNVMLVDAPALWVNHRRYGYAQDPDTGRPREVANIERLEYPRCRVVLGKVVKG